MDLPGGLSPWQEATLCKVPAPICIPMPTSYTAVALAPNTSTKQLKHQSAHLTLQQQQHQTLEPNCSTKQLKHQSAYQCQHLHCSSTSTKLQHQTTKAPICIPMPTSYIAIALAPYNQSTNLHTNANILHCSSTSTKLQHQTTKAPICISMPTYTRHQQRTLAPTLHCNSTSTKH